VPNPFRKRGRAAHRAGEWLAEDVGLCADIRAEFEDQDPGGVALIGDIGGGKTAALDLWRRLVAGDPGAAILTSRLGALPADEALRLERVILSGLANRFGKRLIDEAADALWPEEAVGEGDGAGYRPDEEIELIAEALRRADATVHYLLEEGQGPAELFDAGNPTRSFAAWANRLQYLAEAFRAGGGYLLITITRSPWESLPSSCQDRYVPLIAGPPSARDIEAFLARGLAEAGEGPREVEAGLAEWLFEGGEILSIRALHGRCADAWRAAQREGADTLMPAHFGG